MTNSAFEIEIKLQIDVKKKSYQNLQVKDFLKICPPGSFSMNFTPCLFERQSDSYFENDRLKLVKADMVLRSRSVQSSRLIKNQWSALKKELLLTWKGPGKRGRVKAREEIETQISEDSLIILNKLGCLPALEVIKSRWTQSIEIDKVNVNLSLDAVEKLGVFIEIELIANALTQVRSSEEIFKKIIRQFGLEKYRIETRSYAKLLSGKGK